ncbi:type IV pilus secretin PilQ [Entomomonas asaccharolytica]|uniref:Type IV pilus secretin PilQ n=1 Tax=Entomomonas asaccharolytica TaxID=2785331 RepID=A0A974NII7_9GAMM|nr:type IV pilus secretin PilQ [Entomomonas asaccharolytica]QQP87129.1 type IV pilus secretin PilQ [Entomomonas asaccharolytica]
MNVSLMRLSIALLSMAIPSMLYAANLKDMDVVSLPGERVELKLVFDEPVTAPKGYTIDQPARIALDLPGVSSLLGEKRRTVGIGNVRNLTVVEAKNVTRLVVGLNTLVPYTTRAEGNNIFIVLGDSVSTSPIVPTNTVSTLPTKSTNTVTPVTTKSVASIGNAIENIDFRRGDNGEGNIVVKLSNSTISPDVQERGGKIVLNFPKTQLPESLRVRLDVKDFATPVQFINSTAKSDGSSITIEPKGNYDYLVFQANDELTVSVKHVSVEEKQRRLEDQGIFKGDTLSLNFQDIEVRSVLQILADFTKLNLVATDSVRGNITLRLQNVPWDQALDIIMRTRGLAKRQEGNILIIAPADELAESARRMFDAEQTLKATQPLRREIIPVNYADATSIIALFQATMSQTNSIQAGQNASGMGNYSANMTTNDRGSLTVDKRTNTIIAYQTEERLEELRRIIAQLDRPVRQVQIEARIVEANVDFAKNLGVRWGADFGSKSGNWQSYGGADGRKNSTGSSTEFGNLGTMFTNDGDGYIRTLAAPVVDLGAADATSGFGIGFLSSNVMIDLKLNAMQRSGQGEVISQPKVTTSDKETARIMKGQEVPYQEASSSGATSTSFKEALLSLEVTPQITPDNQIMMAVVVTKDSVNESQRYQGVPPINKNEVNAKVLVSDGETIVLGGVFQNDQSKITEKVPFLGDLPVMGRLFRRDSVSNTKQELLIFITPRIIDNKAFASR